MIGYLLTLTKPKRASQLQKQANDHGFEYRSWHQFPAELRKKRFQFLQWGDTHYVRNWMESKDLCLFEMVTVTDKGTSNQTLFIAHCQTPLEGQILLNRTGMQKPDAFVSSCKNPLTPLSTEEKPKALSDWVILANPAHRMRQLLTQQFIEWLNQHPTFHIEWSDHALLISETGYLLEPEELGTAISDIKQLVSVLQVQHS